MKIIQITTSIFLVTSLMAGPCFAFKDKAAKETFQLVNLDGNDSLNSQEFEQYTMMMVLIGGSKGKLAENASPEAMKQAFAKVDANQDGEITAEELENLR